jgi:hypothetical protein
MPRKKKSVEELSAAEAAAGVQEKSAARKAPARRTESAAPRKPRVRQASPAAEASPAVENVAAAQAPPETNGSCLSQGVSLREQVALLAYSYWEQRGFQGGSPEEDWFRAEQEIQYRLLNGESTL